MLLASEIECAMPPCTVHLCGGTGVRFNLYFFPVDDMHLDHYKCVSAAADQSKFQDTSAAFHPVNQS